MRINVNAGEKPQDDPPVPATERHQVDHHIENGMIAYTALSLTFRAHNLAGSQTSGMRGNIVKPSFQASHVAKGFVTATSSICTLEA